MTRGFKSIQPNRRQVLKENRNSHAFVTSPYEQAHIYSTHQPKASYKHIPQTFTTNINHERALPTQRPTMGGKTISAIRQVTNTVQMSCKELLLLSRRIDPNEPLSSPHDSPSKPPLPILSKKRQRTSSQVQPLQPLKVKKIDDDVVQFICEPCNKKYKTRNGYNYHIERCKSRPIELKKLPIIQCICQEITSDNSTTMIECVQCHHWLHTKCIGVITNELNYSCPSCSQRPHQDSSLISHSSLSPQSPAPAHPPLPSQSLDVTITLADISHQVETNEYNPFLHLFPTEESSTPNEESVLSNTQWEDEFTQNMIFDWPNNTSEQPLPPSLVFSPLDDFSSELLSPTLPQSDWFHFANFEIDFQPTTQELNPVL